ncbi:hypothetical protein BDV28DRAFT_28282 [Aspergillus coremiiformis]|uniref:Uncharacterized protein n=1 Tax=Aspergillus coremiiformis TaxID=138285 RepID=A0A5N6YZZ1_9EURO|nr:hypothetical protein BDV28DRAFT_28282 [Aspergillus coremiiformis]
MQEGLVNAISLKKTHSSNAGSASQLGTELLTNWRGELEVREAENKSMWDARTEQPKSPTKKFQRFEGNAALDPIRVSSGSRRHPQASSGIQASGQKPTNKLKQRQVTSRIASMW